MARALWVILFVVLVGVCVIFGLRVVNGLSRVSTEAPASVEERLVRDTSDAVRQNPESAEARWRLSLALSTIGDYRGALESAERGVRLDPKLTEPYYALGVAYRGLGDTDRAEKAFFKAAATLGSYNEVYREVYFELGQVRMEREAYKKAVEAFEAALANGPEATYVVIALADAYEKSGNTKRATEEYLAVLGYDPTNDAVEKSLRRLGVDGKRIEAARNPLAHQSQETTTQPKQ